MLVHLHPKQKNITSEVKHTFKSTEFLKDSPESIRHRTPVRKRRKVENFDYASETLINLTLTYNLKKYVTCISQCVYRKELITLITVHNTTISPDGGRDRYK